MRNPRLAIALLSVGLVLCLTGCDRTRSNLVGKWQPASGTTTMVWEFSANGAVKAGDTAGRYTLNRNQLKIQTPSATFVYEVTFADDTMIWKEKNGSQTKLTRLP